MASTVPACKAAILAILNADSSLDAITKLWAAPTENEDVPESAELVWLGDTEIPDDNWAALGAQKRRETYRVAVSVWVEQWGDDPQVTEERCWEIWALVTTALRDDLTASGSLLRTAGVQQYGQITATQQSAPSSPQKWGARLDARITFISQAY